MKKIVSILFSVLFISNFAFAQITDPSPYCTAGYHDEPSSSEVRITNVKLNAIDNGSFGGNYTFYDNIDATELVLGETYTMTVEIGESDSAHAVGAWIDYDGNGTFENTELLDWVAGPGLIDDEVTLTFTVPLTALEVENRLRVRVIEDDLYYVNNAEDDILPCASPYAYMLANATTTNDFAYGETEDYLVSMVAVSTEEPTAVVTSANSPFNSIFTDGGTLQMFAEIFPTYLPQAVSWSVLPITGSAYITNDGLLIPLANGSVSVVASTEVDGLPVQGVLNVTIVNQTPAITFSVDDDNEAVCVGSVANYTIDVDIKESLTEEFVFSLGNLPAGTVPNFGPTSLDQDGQVAVSIANMNADDWEGTIYFIATLGADLYSDTLELQFSTFDGNPITPFLNTPADEEINVPVMASFDWFDAISAYSYHIQIATDAAFTDIVVEDMEVFGSGYDVPDALTLYTDYYWRVRTVNPCNNSAWSFSQTFKTVPNNNALGCTDEDAINYDANAQTDDGSCEYEVVGCMDEDALNYNPGADVSDSTLCEYTVYIDYTLNNDTMYNFNIVHSLGTVNFVTWDFGDGSNSVTAFTPSHFYTENGVYEVVATVYSPTSGAFEVSTEINFQAYGCTDPFSYNFSSVATIDDGSCELTVEGCTNPLAANYNPLANVDDGSCDAVIYGCTDEDAFNYDPTATIDNGSCIAVVMGCTDEDAFNYNADANTDDGSCVAVIMGCMDEDAFNYNPNANTDDGSCVAVVMGCTDEDALNYDSDANTDDGSCEYPIATSPSWTVTVTPENHTILIPTTADISVQGSAIEIGDYLGVFYTDADGGLACGGMVEWDGTNTTLSAYGKEDGEDNGFEANETFVWMVWDQTDGFDHAAEVTYDNTMPDQGDYQDDGISSVMTLSTQLTHSVTLNQGWSLISTNIDPTNALMDSVMASINDNLFLVKDEDGDVYWPDFNINNIGDHTIGKAYKIRMNATDELVVAGDLVDPTEHELALPEGWSYLGYLRKDPANISSVLDAIEDDIFIVKNGAGDVYWPQFNINNIGNMTVGAGYQIRMHNDVDFTYPSNETVLPVAKFAAPLVASAAEGIKVTANNMTIGISNTAWEITPEVGSEVVVLNSKGQIVGATVYNEENLVVTVYGSDDLDETIEEGEGYKLGLIGLTGQMTLLSDIGFAIGNSVYKTDDVQLIERIGDISTTEDWTVLSPVGNHMTILVDFEDEQEMQFEIRDISGRLLFSSDKYMLESGTIDIDLPNLPSGQYMLSDQGRNSRVFTKE